MELIILTAFIFGIAAGLMLGVVGWALSVLAGVVLVIVAGIINDLSALHITAQAVGLAVTFQISYVLGLLLQTARTKSRSQAPVIDVEEQPRAAMTEIDNKQPHSGQPQ